MHLSWCFYSKHKDGKCASIFLKIPHSVLLLYLHLLSKEEDEKRKFMSFKDTSTKKGSSYMIILC